MRLSDYTYDLPPELIAQRPLEPRDAARMLVLDRSGSPPVDARVCDLPSYFQPGDLVVVNDTRVIPARLRGRRGRLGDRAGGGGKAELLLVARREPGRWEALARPARRLRPGATLEFCASDGRLPLSAVVEEVLDESRRLVRFFADGPDVDALVMAQGEIPLPPYVRTALPDSERYQTVYARAPGSVAAPTAGLHFTPRLLAALIERGVRWVPVTLHVGPGTFQPLRVGDVSRHRLAPEWAALGADAAAAVNATKRSGRRVVAIGTTVARTLETAAILAREGLAGGLPEHRAGPGAAARAAAQVAASAAQSTSGGLVAPFADMTDLYIYPPFTFRVVDALLTNFHLPRSTLLLLVCAFAGRERVLQAYEAAKEARYRFYSFGDAMLIV